MKVLCFLVLAGLFCSMASTLFIKDSPDSPDLVEREVFWCCIRVGTRVCKLFTSGDCFGGEKYFTTADCSRACSY